MLEPLIVFGVFGGTVWVIAQAIFMLLRHENGVDDMEQRHDTLAEFVEQNYGTHFMPESALGDEGLRRL
jgi:hypothetical protein